MKYCKKCVQPDTRPGIVFNDEGICAACTYEKEKEKINWDERKRELFEIADWAKKTSKSNYDCVIGVSGGKDSTFQALYARDTLGLRTLLVNSEPDNITAVGRQNIENLKLLGFDVISMRPNPKVMKKLCRRAFYKYLNTGKVAESSLFSSAYIIMDQFNIPLLIQGENDAFTLGVKNTGLTVDDNAFSINKSDTLAMDWKELLENDITEKDIFFYRYNEESLAKKGYKGIWLQYYTKEWSQPHNAQFSIDNGLEVKPKDVNPYEIGTYANYFQLDGDAVVAHMMLKYIKFGFGQCTDHVCYDIRARRITREEAIELVKRFDGKCGEHYLKAYCDGIGIALNEFWRVAEQFRGPMFTENSSGNWVLKNPIWEQEPVKGDIDIPKIINRLRF